MARCSQKARWEFVHLFMKHVTLSAGQTEGDAYRAALKLLRYGSTLGRIAMEDCNGAEYPNGLRPEQYNAIQARWEKWMDKEHAKETRVEDHVRQVCAEFGVKPAFSGDPRGCVLKLKMPDGYSNSFGGDGLCVPTA
jgi:hypothetical protein